MESIRYYHQRLTEGSTTVARRLDTLAANLPWAQASNTLIQWDLDAARAQARAMDQELAQHNHLIDFERYPLFGVPIVVKDNIHVQGFTNTAGTPALKNFAPAQDQHCVARLRDAGAIILGKANLHELAMGITSKNGFYGAVVNGRHEGRIAGGSSGGTAAAIAAGVAMAGLGTDTGGSVRIPAALNGICGFRPSSGRYSQQGVTPVSPTRDTVGPMGMCVEDLSRMDAAISEDHTLPDISLSQLRLGVVRKPFWHPLDPSLEAVVERSSERLRKAGVALVEVDAPELESLVTASGFAIVFNELAPALSEYLQAFETGMTFEELLAAVASPDVKAVLQELDNPELVNTETYQAALNSRMQLIDTYRTLLREHRLDGLLLPTTALPAADISSCGETVEFCGQRQPTFPTYIRNTELSSLVGSPSLSIPCGQTQAGLSVGLEIDGAEHQDRRLLAIGLKIEELLEQL
jgi:mandelamide amidase